MVISSNPTPTPTPDPGVGDIIRDIFDRLAAPFEAHEVKVRPGPRGELRYITARTCRRRLNTALGPANWECTITPSETWVKCALTIHLPDGRSLTREALGGYQDMPSAEDRCKSADSDAFKRACATFGIVATTDDGEPSPPSLTRTRPRTQPRGELLSTRREYPGDTRHESISFPDSRAFYYWLKDNDGYLVLAKEIGSRLGLPGRVLNWTPEQIAAATAEILERTQSNAH